MSTESPSHLSKNPQTWIIIILLGVIAALGLAYINKSTDKKEQQKAASSDNSPVSKFAPGLEMIVIPAGSFNMVAETEFCEVSYFYTKYDCPGVYTRGVKKITLKSFAMSKTEVTFAQYDAYTKAVGKPRLDDLGWGRDNRPVIDVSWDDAVAYTRWLSVKTGNSYRLPSETEWEYAARAGTTTKYSWGDDIDCSKASYDIGGECYYKTGNGDSIGTLPVGSYKPNAFGLFDMHGNVQEWVRDCYVYLGSKEKFDEIDSNGRARDDCPPQGVYMEHVLRGGMWKGSPSAITSDARYKGGGFGEEGSTFWGRGFRIAQDI